MQITVNSLAAFKRFLAQPGATVTVIRHDWADNGLPGWEAARVAEMRKPRKVGKLQTNAVKWANGTWTHFDKASQFRCEGERVTMNLAKSGDFSEVCVYQLSLEG